MGQRLEQLKLDAKRDGWAEWIRTPADEAALLEGCWFDVAAAVRVREFFRELLVHSKGSKFAGKPFELLDWQYFDVLGPIFGWKRANGTRRYRRAYVEIPKKNGKSTLASGVSIYLTVGDGEPGAEVYNCATDRDQAGIVYGEAANMVEASRELSRVLKVRRSIKRIIHPASRSWLEAISADADSAEGKNAHGLVMDELHAWRHREFFESLMYAGRSREQPLLFAITTAGDDVKGVCYEEHERAKRVLAGDEIASSYFAYIRAASQDDDWKAPETWAKANPSFGITVNADSFAEDCKEAQESPTKESAFKRYSLNLWVGASNAWMSMDSWERCAEPFDERDLYGLDAWGGIDLSRTRDLSAWVIVVPDEEEFFLVPRLYIPADLVLLKEKIDKAPYSTWIKQGFLKATSGEVVDYAFVRKDVLADRERFNLVQIGYDPHNAEYLCNQQLRIEDGLDMLPIQQTMPNMGPPSTALEALVKQGRVRHGGHPVLRWMMGGCVVYRDSNDNIRPIKRKSTTRIDGVTAAIIGLGRTLGSEGFGGGFYDSNDVELL